jgi:hypothetical protein
LEEVIKKQIREKDQKKSTQKYYLNQIAHDFYKRKGLLPITSEIRFKTLLEKFSCLDTFVNIKDLVQELNTINSGEMLNRVNQLERMANQAGERDIFELARVMNFKELPEYQEHKQFLDRLNVHMLGQTSESNREHYRACEGSLAALRAGAYFNRYNSNDDYQDDRFYDLLYQDFKMCKEEERTIDEDTEITAELREKLSRYKRRLMSRIRAEKDPKQYYNEYKKKAGQLENKMNKILENYVEEKHTSKAKPLPKVRARPRPRREKE